jgi:hypothetical protein
VLRRHRHQRLLFSVQWMWIGSVQKGISLQLKHIHMSFHHPQYEHSTSRPNTVVIEFILEYTTHVTTRLVLVSQNPILILNILPPIFRVIELLLAVKLGFRSDVMWLPGSVPSGAANREVVLSIANQTDGKLSFFQLPFFLFFPFFFSSSFTFIRSKQCSTVHYSSL